MARRCASTRPPRREASGLSQPLAGFVEHSFGLAKGKADEVLPELLAREERRARDSGHADLRDEPAREEGVVIESEGTDVAEHVVRALRRIRSEARGLQRAHQDIAAGAVVDLMPLRTRLAQPLRPRVPLLPWDARRDRH